MTDGTMQWNRSGRPVPVGAVRVDGGECAFDGCDRDAAYLVKVEAVDGSTAKTRVCEPCNDENRIWANRYVQPDSEHDSPAESDAK